MSPAHKNTDSCERKWTVHRQDDNGNRFIVETGLCREVTRQKHENGDDVLF